MNRRPISVITQSVVRIISELNDLHARAERHEQRHLQRASRMLAMIVPREGEGEGEELYGTAARREVGPVEGRG